jgi:hypothetical protein
MTPTETITAYLKQSRRRWVMFLIATFPSSPALTFFSIGAIVNPIA